MAHTTPLFLLATLGALAAPALSQQLVSDDFNRANSTNMGPNWIEGNNDLVIDSNQGRGNTTFANDTWMFHTSFNQPYTQAKAQMEFSRFPGDNLFAGGLVIGLNPNTWGGVAVLVQDNNLDGLFDRIFFNAAINAGAWFSQGTPVFYDFPQQIAAGQLTVWAEDGGDVAVARVEDDLGNLIGTYTASGIVGSPFAPNSNAVGVWVRSRCQFDNFVALEHRPLDAFPAALSLSAGGQQTLDISLGSAHAGEVYLLLVSLSTNLPGIPVGPGVLLPLTLDPLLNWSLANPNTAPYSNTFGVLDPIGHARARLALPAGSFPALAGANLQHCALAINPATLTPTVATNVAATALQP